MNYSHELILPNDDLPFKMFMFEGKDGSYIREKHWHRSVEIFAVFGGSIEFFINEEDTHLEAGEFVIVNSNEIHSVYAPVPNETVVLQIPMAAFANYFTEDNFICFTHSARTQDDRVMGLVKEMYDIYTKGDTGYELRVQSSFYSLLYLMVTRYRKLEVSAEIVRKHKNLNKLSAITTYIKDNYTREISLESLAHIFGYSPAYLSRMFKKYADTNYKAYVQSVRLEYACKEMMRTEREIGEIALNNGFTDGRAFARAFKKKYGVLPSIYRRTKNGS